MASYGWQCHSIPNVGRSLNNRNILESGISVTKFNFSLSILFLWFSTNRILITFSVNDSILATSIATRNWRKLEGRIQFAKVSYQQNGLLHNRSFIVQYKFCNHVNSVNLFLPKPFPINPVYITIKNDYLEPSSLSGPLLRSFHIWCYVFAIFFNNKK